MFNNVKIQGQFNVLQRVWFAQLDAKNKWRESPKAVTSYTSAPVMVHLGKPAQAREGPITDKTGGCNNDAGCCGKNWQLKRLTRKGRVTQVDRE
jgi:hypothetical protein